MLNPAWAEVNKETIDHERKWEIILGEPMETLDVPLRPVRDDSAANLLWPSCRKEPLRFFRGEEKWRSQ